ncbi:hypothetical protein SAMN05216490_4777 [Mucilaginibacter mallensis]|uniref:Fibronectin type-III domain-containing protein n=1 Tax=Mucilaginibacter mallensis TaxID=652787 RepID=A0A1H2CA76_MUCMA|nr:hypothetical protein [Mucilaginibacter mallensis]SDT67274.1 hypothetical protein SAMN05216490_4777 [Mucilaginibacter mallensis]
MKFKPTLYLFLTISIMQVLYSCQDIIEPSISKSNLQLEAPTDQYISPSYAINFWWDAVDHAISYHLQVVSRTFASPGGLVLDTIVSTNKFTANLNPGSYQWRVMAENGSSQTAYANPRTLTVAASSIKQQAVLLTSPANNYLTNQTTVALSWGALYGATKYQLQVDTNSFTDTTKLVYNKVIATQQLNFTFPKNQTYQWRVRAENDTAYSVWSLSNTVTFDNIPPAQVVLSSPANSITVSSPVNLQWTGVSGSKSYKVYVFKSDSTTSYNSTFPVSVNTTDYNFTLGASGDKIYWKVSAVDAAGNEGTTSVLRSFVLQ